ncbi:MAG: hypothetical protein U0031_01970 [Thermomicrobiales bacterium]
MDFVVVGLILGAVAILAGVALLGWAAPRAIRAGARAKSPREAARADATAAAMRSGGGLMLIAGGLVFLVTFGALVGAADDRIGALAIASTATVLALAILVWGFQNRNSIPWFAPRSRPMPAPAPLERNRRPAVVAGAGDRPAAAEALDRTAPLMWDEGEDDLDPEHEIVLVGDDSEMDGLNEIAEEPATDEEGDTVVVGSAAAPVAGDS